MARVKRPVAPPVYGPRHSPKKTFAAPRSVTPPPKRKPAIRNPKAPAKRTSGVSSLDPQTNNKPVTRGSIKPRPMASAGDASKHDTESPIEGVNQSSKHSSSSTDSPANVPASVSAAAAGSEAPAVVKKKRGRPKKVQIADSPASAADSETIKT
ncbi:hypothetical protein LTR53_018855, partial [Teratosphaeriaceae sp. CCFEE 6253]